MKTNRFGVAPLAVVLVWFISAVGVSGAALAQVSASLVSAESSVQPGKPITVAVRLEHETGWHTYWVNPGTGQATQLTWELPGGWVASDIQWPAPILIEGRDGDVTGYGYEGTVYLPVTLTAPESAVPGHAVALSVRASWLMCTVRTCVPGEGRATLSLPVLAETPRPNEGVARELASMPMPEAAAGLNMSAIAGVDHIVLKVSGAVLGSPHFFGEQPDFLAFDAPQSVEMKEHEYVMRLPVSEGLEPWPARLKGVLAYTDSVGKYHGRRVDLPISRGGNAATRNESGASAQVRDASPAAGSMVGTLLFALLGGLVLNLMPCVFPVLGIKVLGFVNQAGNDRLQVRSHGLVFTAGVLLSFWALVGLLAFLRAAGVGLGWGFQLQSPEFVFALVLIIFVFGLNLSGAFEFGTTLTGIGGRLHLRLGYAGSFFSGVLATVVATPCSAPFLAPALAVALSLPLLQSFLVFTAIALGLSLPYLLLSCFPQALSHLPRAGRWMETFKQAMAFPLYATAAYLLWVLGGQTQEDAYLTSLLGLAVVAMGVWLYGRYSRNGSARPQIGRVAGVLLVAAGTYMGWPHEAQAAVTWEPWSAARVAELRAEQRPIYVDFTARWCATCQANKKLVFSSKAVLEMFAARKVAALKADWTNQDPHITQELQKWHRGAVPFDLVYRSGAAEPTVLPEVLTPGIVLEAIQ